ncbi:MAG: TVP38/TMEM64 family protein [Caldimicrobium sp.]
MIANLLSYWQDRTLLRDIVEENPIKGALIFLILQVLQVVLAPLPGEVTGFVAGFLFGTFLGFFLSTLGILIGSALSFLIASFFKKHFLLKYENHPNYVKIKKLFRKHGLYGVFFLYLFPGFPKDLLNYLMAFMPIKLRTFLILSNLGRAPGTFALALQGDVVYGGHPYRILLVSSGFLLAFVIFLLLKKNFEKSLYES